MRRLATAAFSFSAAVLLALYLPVGLWVYWCAAALAVLSLAGVFLKAPLRARLLLLLPAVAAGLLWTAAYRRIAVSPGEALYGTESTVRAVVTGNPVAADYGARVEVRVSPGGGRPVNTLLYIYGRVPTLRPGNTIVFTARFKPADTMSGRETRSFYASGIYLLAHCQGDITVTDATSSLLYLPARTAGRLSAMIDRLFPAASAGFMRALLLGDTTRLNADLPLSAALKTTGTWHIVSVSGMNIAFLTGLLGLFIRKKKALAAAAIPVILFFMALVGFTPSVTRAGLMQFFVLLAPLFRRESDAVTSLSASLVLILLANPFAAAGAGLQLSFAATLGLLLFSGRMYTAVDSRLAGSLIYRRRPVRQTVRGLIGGASASAGALVFTLPLTALHFGTVSLIAPLSNILILWAVTLAFYAGAAAVAAGFILLPAGLLAARIAALPFLYIAAVVKWLARFPFASLYTQNTAIVIWLVFVYLALIVSAAMRVRLRNLLIPASASLMLLCLILVLTAVFGFGAVPAVTVLDVGQGQCVVIADGGFTAVVDCGSLNGNAAETLAAHLQSAGRLRIDLLILTHYHEDHADGVPEILERIPVGCLALPDPSIDAGPLTDRIISLAEEKNIRRIVVDENLSLTADRLVLRLYAPLGSAGENERGLAVLCTNGAFDALITGDMGAPIERRLLAAAVLPDIELLVVGHHGSRHSTSDELLETLRPEIGVISVGYNSYGHPSPATLRRLAGAGVTIYRTDQNGTVAIPLRG
jgi:competence protein ComEC